MESEQLDFIKDVLEEVKQIVRNQTSKNYFMKNIEDESTVGFISSDFSFYYLEKTRHFYITFMVGTTCKFAAEITKSITKIIEEDLFSVVDDYFWDKETKEVAYGDDAVHMKYKNMLKKQGLVKCEICSRIVPTNFIQDSGFCKHCEKTKNNITWN